MNSNQSLLLATITVEDKTLVKSLSFDAYVCTYVSTYICAFVAACNYFHARIFIFIAWEYTSP